MNKARYVIGSPEQTVYTFQSTGRLGVIEKVVLFQEIDTNLFNLVLLDFDIKKNIWNDEIVSNNGDMTKVLATVAFIIHDFLTINVPVKVYIEANSLARNKLYNRIFKNYSTDFGSNIKITGLINGEVFPFDRKIQFDSFYLQINEVDA